jgi:hypothetical protein
MLDRQSGVFRSRGRSQSASNAEEGVTATARVPRHPAPLCGDIIEPAIFDHGLGLDPQLGEQCQQQGRLRLAVFMKVLSGLVG